MLELGVFQTLIIVKKEEFGVYLAETSESGRTSESRVLLPKKQVPEDSAIGDSLRVFLYRDSSDRMIATVNRPKILLHEVARLKVKMVTKIGAFLDWGLEKDLLLPFHEQMRHIYQGDEVLVALYIDKSGRLCATMRIYPYLKTQSPYQVGDEVTGTVYQNAENFGVFIAVDDMYSGMIPRREAQANYEVGSTMKFRVTGVKEDGKLDLSAREKSYLQIDRDAEQVLSVIAEEFSGELPFDDKADPQVIRETFGLSKAAFKRAVGHLYKERKIVLAQGTIRMTDI